MGADQGGNLCYDRICRTRAIGAWRHQRRRRANSTNGRSTTANRVLGTGRGGGATTRTEEKGLLTVCRLNVLGPLLNQLTYCLCGRQPLPCLHGTFLLSLPSYPAALDDGGGGVPSARPSGPSSSSSFFTLPKTADTFCVALRLHSRRFSMTDASANTRVSVCAFWRLRANTIVFLVCATDGS